MSGEVATRSKLQWEIWSKQYEKWLDEFERDNPGSIVANPEAIEPSTTIRIPLLRFQKEWLSWALNQEASETKGGILADETGMGKTIQAISLVLTARDMHLKSDAGASPFVYNNKSTLVICPVVGINHWVGEIERHTEKGKVSVLVYRGAKRAKGEVNFSQYDFVLTSYSTIESDYRKYIMAPKEKCHGNSALHSVKWERVILDEARYIKDCRSNTARAIFALQVEYKWALGGIPFQNRVGELYYLIRFLEIYPYSCYFCKDCNCSLQDFSTSNVCSRCEHSWNHHFSWWNKYIAEPIQNVSTQKGGERAMILLRDKILKNIMLRRTKKGRAADITLPPKIVILRRDSLDERERDFYRALNYQCQTRFDSYVAAGTLMSNYVIFNLLFRLREAVNHPYLVLYSSSTESPTDGNNVIAAQADCGLGHTEADDAVFNSCKHAFCKICQFYYCSRLGSPSFPICSAPLTKNCEEPSHKACISKVKGFASSSILNRMDLSMFRTSTKIEALVR